MKKIVIQCNTIRVIARPYTSKPLAPVGTLALAQGPPGTGKTQAILGLLSAVLHGHQSHEEEGAPAAGDRYAVRTAAPSS